MDFIKDVSSSVKNAQKVGTKAMEAKRKQISSDNTGNGAISFPGISGQQVPTANSYLPAGFPQYPGFQSGISNDTILQSRPDIHANLQALTQLRNESLVPSSESPWLKNQLQQIDLQKKQGIEDVARKAAGEDANARTALAMRGGLSGGAAERLAMVGSRNALTANQDVRRNAQGLGLAAAQTAEENRLGNLRALPGMEIAATQPEFANRSYQTGNEQFNIGNRLQDISQRNAYNFGKYQEEAKAIAAKQMADAIGSGGGSGGTLGNVFNNLGKTQTYANPVSILGGPYGTAASAAGINLPGLGLTGSGFGAPPTQNIRKPQQPPKTAGIVGGGTLQFGRR